MALNIPLPGMPGTGFLEGLNTGSSLFSRMMEPKLKRELMAQEWQKHLDALALQKAAGGRASQAAEDAHKLALMKMDPNYAINQMLRAQQAFGGGGTATEAPSQLQSFMPGIGGQFGQLPEATPEESPSAWGGNQAGAPNQFDALQQKILEPLTAPQEGVPQINEQAISPYEAAQAKPKSGLDMDAIKKSPILRGMFKKLYGIDPGAESPEDKRASTLQDKILLEQYKHQQKQADAQQSAELKNAATQQKVITAAKADIPHLEETKRSLEIMKTIAENNPDLFGHYLIGHEKAAKFSSNPAAGAWQTYGVDPIVATEMKMSSKGNVPALKFAIANKPNFAENQQVALSKIKASIDKINHAIEESKKIAGEKSNKESGIVRMIKDGIEYDIPADKVQSAESKGYRRG